jgi:hypothetical protein
MMGERRTQGLAGSPPALDAMCVAETVLGAAGQMESILKSQEDQFAGLLDKLRTWRCENKIEALPEEGGYVVTSPLNPQTHHRGGNGQRGL